MKDMSYYFFFQALSNRTRLAIIESLRDGPKNVTELYNELKLEQSRVSHHLRCLKFCGFVSNLQNGKTKVYSLNEETLAPVLKIADEHVEKYARNLRYCEELEY